MSQIEEYLKNQPTPEEYINNPQIKVPLILIGDVIEKLRELPKNCVDVIITSPPYWQQRNYGVRGEIGQEKTPENYIQKMVEVGNELKRVLKDTGSYFLNMGDKYVGKNLQMIPFKTAIKMQENEWIIRNTIIWYKPNHMPSSIKDRLGNVWEPTFFFVKDTGKYFSQEYYVNLDSIRIPHKTKEEDIPIGIPPILSEEEYEKRKNEIEQKLGKLNGKYKKYKGKFKGNEINVGASPAGRQALTGIFYSKQRKHKITPDLEVEIIKYLRYWKDKKSVTPKEIDKILNKKDTAGHWFRLDHGRSLPRPEDWWELKKILEFDNKYDKVMTETQYVLQAVMKHPKGKNPGDMWSIPLERFSEAHFSIFPVELPRKIIQAFCPKDGIVLDPFAGSGSTGKAAFELERKSILIDIKPEYAKLMLNRCGLSETYLRKFLK